MRSDPKRLNRNFEKFSNCCSWISLGCFSINYCFHRFSISYFKRSAKDSYRSSSRKISKDLFQSFWGKWFKVFYDPNKNSSRIPIPIFSVISIAIFTWIPWIEPVIPPQIYLEISIFHPRITAAVLPKIFRVILKVKSLWILQYFIWDFTPADFTAIIPTIFTHVSFQCFTQMFPENLHNFFEGFSWLHFFFQPNKFI